MKIQYLTFLFSAFLIFASCSDDDNSGGEQNPNQNQDHNPTAFAQNFGNEISRNFLGTVVDTNNDPIENVMITIGSSTAMTDSNGVFIINNATVNQRFGYVKAEKTGYIHASRSVVPSSGTNKVRIMMLTETITGTTNSGSQETISLSNGSKVALEGEYVKLDGTVYDGNVNVIMHHLDPVDNNMQDQMPGMLYAANSDNEERMLQTFGMLAVELRGENGEDLNLAEGSTAEITVPLDASLIATAPSTIPLWYFDEDYGYWIEDGEATLVGNTYVGTVSHFSFWNCDIPRGVVTLCLNVTDSNGNDLTGVTVTLTSDLSGSRDEITNHKGEVCGLVPSSETLVINTSFGNCHQNINVIGPFIEDSYVEIVITDNSSIISETITGNFTNCDQQAIEKGYVLVQTDYYSSYQLVTDGSIDTTILRCANESDFTLQAHDASTFQSANEMTFSFTTPVTDIGTISACGSSVQSIQYTIDGTENFAFVGSIINKVKLIYNTNNSTFPLNTYLLQIETFASEAPCFRIIGILTQDFNTLEGTYDYWYMEDENDNRGITFSTDADCGYFVTPDNNAVFNLNGVGEVGQFIDLTFSLDYNDSDGQLHTMDGVIHVIRDPDN
ncbi:carboxypeptidase-like regulatory domain-containing protein [uncultured Psychroserpens sp.]|uniref:carboxypeptidase-like regulatory domain-containing protein n=1 Tax=uncultured Psychroserpens sp. TaxID=255436 RepID=UPI002624FCDD|nr:carboxypeptidase-like regulatory domain-containing protein [uncultured Psychroserpens sp.]